MRERAGVAGRGRSAMRVLVTGASGFVGRHVVRHLGVRHEVLAPTHEELELEDALAVRAYFAAHPVDVVVHSAGKPGHWNGSEASSLLDTTLRMFLNLVREHDRYERLVLMGSGAVYDPARPLARVREEALGESVPKDAYAFAKYTCARLAEPLDFVVELRPFGVYGPGEDYLTRFISNAICRVLLGLPIALRRDRRFSYVWAEDLASVVEHFVTVSRPRAAAYNVVPADVVTLKELSELVLRVSEKHAPVIVAEEGEGPEYSGSSERLLKDMPGARFTDIQEGIARLYSHYAANKESIDLSSLVVEA